MLDDAVGTVGHENTAIWSRAGDEDHLALEVALNLIEEIPLHNAPEHFHPESKRSRVI